MKIRKLLCALAIASAGTGTAQPSGVTLTLSLYAVTQTTVDGVQTETFTPAERVQPGTVLVQRALLHTGAALRGGHITVPVPRNTVYLGGATRKGELTPEFSADGGKTFSTAPTRTITVTDHGQTLTKIVAVPLNEYTTVRWTVHDLPAGTDTRTEFRVRVN